MNDSLYLRNGSIYLMFNTLKTGQKAKVNKSG